MESCRTTIHSKERVDIVCSEGYAEATDEELKILLQQSLGMVAQVAVLESEIKRREMPSHPRWRREVSRKAPFDRWQAEGFRQSRRS
jgi:hypothetical protein